MQTVNTGITIAHSNDICIKLNISYFIAIVWSWTSLNIRLVLALVIMPNESEC